MKLVAIVLMLFGFAQVMAADGSSGCGPGWFVLKDNSLVSSALRATTNAVLAPVTTIGMTLGTSNCTKHKIVEKEKESLHFVTHNVYELKGDVAAGGGPYLQALSHTMGCKSGADLRLGEQMKSSYQEVFRHLKPASVLEETYKVILRDPQLTHACSLG